FNNLSIVCTLGVQPKDCWSLSCTSACDSQFDPVADRNVLSLGRTPDVTGFNLVAHQDVVSRIDDFNSAIRLHNESFVVGAVFFGLLRHQTNVWHRTHGGWIVGTIGTAVFN